MTKEEFIMKYSELQDNVSRAFKRKLCTSTVLKFCDEQDYYLIDSIPKLQQLGLSYKDIADLTNYHPATIISKMRYGKSVCSSLTKKDALKRDNKTCCKCGAKRNAKLHVHHIFDSHEHSLENLMTLCVKCHFGLHKIKDKEPEEYKQVITQILNKKI